LNLLCKSYNWDFSVFSFNYEAEAPRFEDVVRTDALDAEVAASGVTKQMEKDLQAGLFTVEKTFAAFAHNPNIVMRNINKGIAIHAIIAKYGHIKKPSSLYSTYSRCEKYFLSEKYASNHVYDSFAALVRGSTGTKFSIILSLK
jgi:hypothetical protein